MIKNREENDNSLKHLTRVNCTSHASCIESLYCVIHEIVYYECKLIHGEFF
jgi:hypothetical protein